VGHTGPFCQMGCAGAVGARDCRHGVDRFPLLRQGNLPRPNHHPSPLPSPVQTSRTSGRYKHTVHTARHATHSNSRFIHPEFSISGKSPFMMTPLLLPPQCRQRQSYPGPLSSSFRGTVQTRGSLISTIMLRKPSAVPTATGDIVHTCFKVERGSLRRCVQLPGEDKREIATRVFGYQHDNGTQPVRDLSLFRHSNSALLVRRSSLLPL
jgi:hypothetical protein